MKRKTIALILVLCGALPLFPQSRIVEDFNFDWKFNLGDTNDAHAPGYNDAPWRSLRLPHDWSIEFPYTEEKAGGATGFLPGGIGWYRKTFSVAESNKNQVIWIEFDGVYNNSEVWINGHYLGYHPYGYTPFSYNLTPYLKYGAEKNTIAVKVDRSAYLDCRWYPGSGIYRNVKLITASKIHVPQYGTYITTPKIADNKAEVLVQTTIENYYDTAMAITLSTTIYDGNNTQVAEKTVQRVVSPETPNQNAETFTIDHPALWEPGNPALYRAVSKITSSGKVVDEYTTRFGIRQFLFDANKGFFINGKNILIKGVCLHGDAGPVGTAVPIGVWERRLKILRDELGCNAIRTAHNPYETEFYDLCDRMGFLVQDEAFDEWDNAKDKRKNYHQQKEEEITKGYSGHFAEWAERDIKSMVKRDRNHPSIIMWSIGNEIEWTYPRYRSSSSYADKPGTAYYFDFPLISKDSMLRRFALTDSGKHELATTAKKLSAWVKELDTTRPVTANMVIPTVSCFSGYADALDIVGLSYRAFLLDYLHENMPNKPLLGTENCGQWYEWQPVLEKPFYPSVFLWTGINYLGESETWPLRGNTSGLLDVAGFKNPSFYMFQSLWNSKPMVYLGSSKIEKGSFYALNDKGEVAPRNTIPRQRPRWGWHNVNQHWNYTLGDSIALEVYTNCEKVELFHNKKSLGTKTLKDNYGDHILKWFVPFAEGTVEAVGTATDGSKCNYPIKTASAPYAINLLADKKSIHANNYDVVHIEAQLTDNKGNKVFHADADITFEIEGPCTLIGVDNGSANSVQAAKAKHLITYRGKALAIVQAGNTPGEITIKASSGGIISNTLIVKLAAQSTSN